MGRDDLNEFVRSWISGWNDHNLASILSHYDEDVVLHSPMIARVTGKEQSSMCGRSALRTYWAKAFELAPDLRFTLQAVLYGSGTLTILYRNQLGRRASETFIFNEHMKVVLSAATYAAA